MTLAITTVVLICIVNATLGSHELATDARRFEFGALHEAAAVSPSPQRSLLGFDAIPLLTAWLAKLPRAFEEFVGSEQREQVIRRLRNVSRAFASVNVNCITLAVLVERPGASQDKLQADFDDLLASIIQLRKAVLELAYDLGPKWGQEGGELASELARLTRYRANMTREARQELLGGDPKEAARKLLAAADLAESAQKAVIHFLQTVAKQ